MPDTLRDFFIKTSMPRIFLPRLFVAGSAAKWTQLYLLEIVGAVNYQVSVKAMTSYYIELNNSSTSGKLVSNPIQFYVKMLSWYLPGVPRFQYPWCSYCVNNVRNWCTLSNSWGKENVFFPVEDGNSEWTVLNRRLDCMVFRMSRLLSFLEVE